jgi:hypothetical protein
MGMGKAGRRRWLQFTIRQLLVFAMCAGPALGWCAIRWRRAHRVKPVVEAISCVVIVNMFPDQADMAETLSGAEWVNSPPAQTDDVAP